MNEAVFPLLGPFIVFAMVLPLSALVAKVLLAALARIDSGAGVQSYHGARYALLVASSALPLCWFVSASLHQTESGQSASVCAAEHAPGAFCAEGAYFALALCVLVVMSALPRLVREQFMLRAASTASSSALQARIERLSLGRAGLSALSGRVIASDAASTPIATVGIFSPSVVVQTAFADALDDDALVSALHHELEHLLGRDPLRYFIAWWALAVNPFGRWQLCSEHARWLLEREAHCDRQAVASGASAAALAQALLVAARPRRVAETTFQARLGSGHVEAVRLRLGLLLAYADRTPCLLKRDHSFWMLLATLAFAVALPHHGGTHLLDVVHAASERAGHFVTGN